MTIARREGVRRPSWQDEEKARFGARTLASPEPGYFAMRMVKGGVFVAAEIRYEPTRDPLTGEALERCWYWHGLIDGAPDPDPSPTPQGRTMWIWERGRRVSAAEFGFLRDDRKWAREFAPHLPEANPREPVDLSIAPPPF